LLTSFASFYQVAPAADGDCDTKFAGGRSDAPPDRIPLGVADAPDLIESRDRIAHVAGVVDRLLPFLGKCEPLRGHLVLLPRA
jgi:hypothetical protein